MKENFAAALQEVLKQEGGWSNHPKDPGGATMCGITQRVYDAWRARKGLKPRSVRDITEPTICEIYRRQYWDAVRGDDLPAGVDLAVFDFAVNSGPVRAAKFLQAAVGEVRDGHIGAITLAAVAKADRALLASAVCDRRLAWLHGLETYPAFGKGWRRRIAAVRAAAVKMAA